jgi:DNA-directed RNA polymerase specialized sigma24 family protein
MLLEHEVRLYFYLSTMSAAKTQYLIDQLDFSNNELDLWRQVVNSRSALKKVLIPSQFEGLPDWVVWPNGLSVDIWRDFVMRSSRLSVDVLILSFILKKSDSEIAKILNMTEGGVLIVLSDGLARLGEHLK